MLQFPLRPISIALGITQIVAFGTSFYLLGVLAIPISESTGWPLPWIAGGMTLGALAGATISPTVGEQISKGRGRKTLALSSVLFAAGLLVIASSSTLPVYFLGWIFVGFAMASGLYDAVFSVLGHIFGAGAKFSISLIAILGGFASTVFWIASGMLLEVMHWRTICVIYALCHVAINLPIYLLFIPSPSKVFATGGEQDEFRTKFYLRDLMQPDFLLMAFLFMLEVIIASIIGVHIINILVDMGRPLAGAVAFAALIGPSQVAGRIAELLAGSVVSPTIATICALAAIGLGLLVMGIAPQLAGPAIVIYGAGIGVVSIARGTLPLHILGASRYSVAMGHLARPIAIAQAAAPTIGALMLTYASSRDTLIMLVIATLIALSAATILHCRSVGTGRNKPR
ncbi:MFS transporter [Hyphobacterium sp.]|jgi:hypothetical protein|uniref:MFS transporter n=1 Tax=Hyphobacterium sp. TaxID=2004662 RepID=UPI003BA96796